MQGNLYLVSTPISNLDDLTIRAKHTLSDVDVIFAESVERTKKLLLHFNIDTRILSYNKDNEKRKSILSLIILMILKTWRLYQMLERQLYQIPDSIFYPKSMNQ